MERFWNHFYNRINPCIRHTHNSADITQSRLCLKCAECYNLCNMVCTVFLGYIFYNLTPAFVAKIYVKIGHRHTLRIEKTLKNKVVFHRVKVGYSDTVSSKRTCTRTSARTYRNILAFGKTHKILNYQIIIRIPHFVYGFKLIFKAVNVALRHRFTVSFVKTLVAHLPEKLKMVHIIRRCKIRKFCVAEFKIEVARICNFLSIFYCTRSVTEQFRHLAFTL